MNGPDELPFYIRASVFSMGLLATISMLYIAQDIILPLIYALMFAITISPVVVYLMKRKLNRTLSIAVVLFISILIVTALVALLSSQASNFSRALPRLTDKLEQVLLQTVTWSSGYFNISAERINDSIAGYKNEFINNSSANIGTTLSAMSFLLASAVLTVVYICMILFYQAHLLEFIHKFYGADNNRKVSEMLAEIKTIVQSYLSGLFAEFAIVAVLNSVGLLVLRIDYAILLGIIGALLNVIPYVGGLVGVGLFMMIALVTKPPVYVFYVAALYSIIQFIDNNYIVPKIVGSKVKLNALVCVIAVIAGGALWGLPGMFLSIPLTAIIKLTFDRIDSLKSWGFLLGETATEPGKVKFNFTIKGFLQNFTQQNKQS